MLRFVRPRIVLPVDPGDAVARARPWLEGLQLAPGEREQLVSIVQRLDESLDEQRILHGSFDTFAETGGVAEVPLECWDVEDEGGRVRYQLWLYCADAGCLFAAGTTRQVGAVAQLAFFELLAGGESRGALATQLARAQREVVAPPPASQLRQVEFVRPALDG